MNSFIYKKDILDKLISIAQVQPKENQALTNKLILNLINDIKTSKSSAKAEESPSITDLLSLEGFSNWAKNKNASFNNQSLFNTASTWGNDINIDALKGFLLDLQKRTANNPKYREAVANLIEQANEKHKLEIQHIDPKKLQQQQPVQNQQSAQQSTNQRQPDKMIGNQDETVIEGRVSKEEAKKVYDLLLLNGVNFDTDEIPIKTGKIYSLLNQYSGSTQFMSTIKVLSNIMGRINFECNGFSTIIKLFNNAYTGDIVLAPNRANSNVALNVFKAIFQGKFTSAQIGTAMTHLINLMTSISQFNQVLLRIPELEKSFGSELNNQITMASNYITLFETVENQLTELAKQR